MPDESEDTEQMSLDDLRQFLLTLVSKQANFRPTVNVETGEYL